MSTASIPLRGWQRLNWRDGVLLLVLLALYLPMYVELAHTVWRSDSQSHGPLVLLVCLGLAWRARSRQGGLARPARRPGLLLLATGLIVWLVGRWQGWPTLVFASQWPVLIGLLAMRQGWRSVGAMGFALCFLLFALPVPPTMVSAVSEGLRVAVAEAVETLLFHVGYPISRQGTVLTVDTYKLVVADACSGWNTLLSLAALSMLYLREAGHRSGARIAAVAAAVLPLAVLANTLRVSALVLIVYHAGEAAGQGVLHGLTGILLFLFALGGLLLVDRLLGWWVDDADASRV